MLILMTDTNYIRKGDIFNVELGTEWNGHVQSGGASGFRPCVVMANKTACAVSPVLLVVPITSSCGKQRRGIPTHLELGDTLPRKSVALFEQVLTVNRCQLRNKITNLSEDLLEKANEKIMISFGIVPQKA